MNNASEKILHFTLGPVQGFVAEARRTRDLWGGSFLLSWLAGHAMRAVIEGGGKIVFPSVHDGSRQPIDPLLKAIMQGGICKPRIGTLPNRFKAQVPADFDPALCADAIWRKWFDLCHVIQENYVDPIINNGCGTATIDIWKRQTEHFWEINWVCDADPGDKSDVIWLDLRKNWRSHRPTDEGGDHCMVMGDWQELSGFIRSKSREEREKQDQFWKKFRSQQGIGKLDLRDDERLCAIAIVKRLFPLVARQTIGWDMDIRNWPSTSYMAAIHWLPAAWEVDKPSCQEYAKSAEACFAEGIFGERSTKINSLEKVAAGDQQFRRFSGLDGSIFQLHALANNKLIPLKNGVATEIRKYLMEKLKALMIKTSVRITPYYAFLVMDGDEMGALLRKYPEDVSKGLAEFTDKVENIVSDNNGVLIYAGGDDVLAMFPIDDAINAAHALRKAYSDSFNNVTWASISASIIYAHHHQPLRSVLHLGHQHLDNLAKEQNGRDSLALAVIKGGDVNASWVSCWEPSKNFFPALELTKMADDLRKDPQFSSRFLFTLRDRFNDLMDQGGRVVHGIDMTKILLAEYLKNRENSIKDKDKARDVVECLVKAVSCYPRGNPYAIGTVIQRDGPILLRFLANRGVHE